MATRRLIWAMTCTMRRRGKATDQVVERLAARITDLPVTAESGGMRGATYEVQDQIVGPNGKAATVRTFWLLDKDGGTIPRMLTNWAETHREREENA